MEREILLKEMDALGFGKEILTMPQITLSTKKTFDLGEKAFDFKYVTIKIRIELEVFGKIKSKKALVGIKYDPNAIGKEFSISAKKEIAENLELKGSITPGEGATIGVETKYFGRGVLSFDAKLNWTAIFEAKYEIPLSKKISIGDWEIEGGGKLILKAVIGPNWKQIAWSAVKGWKAITRVVSSMISAAWTTSAGTATTLKVVVSTVGLVAVAVGVPLYLLYKTMTAEAEGKIEVLGNRYASGYARTLCYKLTYSDISEFGINDFRINITGKFKGSIQTWSGKEAWPKIEKLGRDDKLRQKALSKTLRNAYRDLNPQGTEWFMTRQNAEALGAAHALSTTLNFARLLKLMYGTYDNQTGAYKHNKETEEIVNTLKRINSTKKEKLRKEITDFISNQFKNKVGKEEQQIEGFPLDLSEVIKSRIR